MSKLDELIRELCPDGVEYKTLGEIAVDIYRGAGITRDQVTVDGTPCVRYGEIYTTYGVWFDKCVSHTDEAKLTSKKYFEYGDVLFAITGESVDDIAKCCAYIGHEKCLAGGDIVVLKHNQDPKYLSYVLATTDARQQKSKGKVKSKVVHSSVPAIREIKVPIPPIEIQREIVRILDDYTENIVELQNQLTAEITARQKQYEFYRDKLLTFDVLRGGTIDFDREILCRIADLGKWSGGKTPSMAEKKYWESGTIPWVSSKDVKQPILSDTIDHITNAAVDEASMTVYPAGSVAIVTRSGILRHTFPVTYIPFETTVNQDIKILVTKEGISSRYVSHALQAYGESIRRTTKKQGGTVDSLDFQKVLAYKIPVPPLDVQNRIVNVLDNFEKICSDLNIGLPAEIEARQKQYEYYRDKLLTFAENGNTILSRAEQSRAEQSRAEQSRAEQSRALIKLLQYVFGYAVVSLQDVVKNSCSGGTPKKGVSEYYEDGNIPWLRTQEVVFRDICKTECFITESAVKNSAAKWIPENCVIVAISGATAGRCAINKIPLTTNQHCLNLEVDPEMALYRYVYYCICAKQEELLAKKEGARGDLNSTRILSLQIDLPALEEQKRIVSILDRFDTICNDLTSGLPAEIEARQKQYEYYRDKLLTFKEVAAT